MAYARYGNIEAGHYNGFVWGAVDGTPTIGTNIYSLWGTGYGDKGLGQDMSTVPAAQVNPNTGSLDAVQGNSAAATTTPDTISATQWVGLLSAINRMKWHQSTGNLSLASIKTGDTISVIASLSSALTSASTNTGTGRVGGPSSPGAITRSWVVASTASALSTTFTTTLTWSTGDSARYFFNAGGKIAFEISATTSGSDRSSNMVTCINELGSVTVDYSNNTGFNGIVDAGTFTGAGRGYWDMGTTNKVLGKHTLGSGTYSDSYVQVQCRVTGTPGANGDVGNQMIFTVTTYSGYGTTGPAGLTPSWQTDSINLALSMTASIINPIRTGTGGVLEQSWSTPTVS